MTVATTLASMSPSTFAKWLAGFFDGEGCVYLPSPWGIEVSIANTNRSVIMAVHRRLGVGYVQIVLPPRPGWSTKYHWRCRDYEASRRVLSLMRRHLTIKASVADRALKRIAAAASAERELRRRNARMLRLAERGLLHRQIATRLGVSRIVRFSLARMDEGSRQFPLATV